MCYSHYYGATVRARNLIFSGKRALGMTMPQNSEKLEMVAMETLKSGIADFEAYSCPEAMIFAYPIVYKLE